MSSSAWKTPSTGAFAAAAAGDDAPTAVVAEKEVETTATPPEAAPAKGSKGGKGGSGGGRGSRAPTRGKGGSGGFGRGTRPTSAEGGDKRPGFIPFDDSAERAEIKKCTEELNGKFDRLKQLQAAIEPAKAESAAARAHREKALAAFKAVQEALTLATDAAKGSKKAASDRLRELDRLKEALPYRAPNDCKSPKEVAAFNLGRIAEEVAKLEREREACTTPGEDRQATKDIQREEAKRRLVADYVEAAERLLQQSSAGGPNVAAMSVDEMKAEMDVRRKEIDAARASETALKTSLDALFAELKAVKEAIDALKAKRTAASERLTARKKEFDEKMAARRKEEAARRAAAKEEREKREAEYRERHEKEAAARAEAEARKVPFEDDIRLCSDAVAYLAPLGRGVSAAKKSGKKGRSVATDRLLTHEPHVTALFAKLHVSLPVLASQVHAAILELEAQKKDLEAKSAAELERRKAEPPLETTLPLDEAKTEESVPA